MENAEKTAYLRQVPQFESLADQEILALSQAATLIELENESTLIQEGEEGTDAFVLLSGALQVFQQSPIGNLVVLARLEPTRLFGEQSALARNQNRRTASVVALKTSKILRLEGAAFGAIMRKNLDLHSEINRIGNFQEEANRFLTSPLVAAIGSRDILDQCERLELSADTIIFEQGDRGDEVFLVVAGQVNIIRQIDQSFKKIGHIKSGYSFGEIAGDGGGQRSATAKTETDSALIKIPRKLFSSILEEDQDLTAFMGALSNIYQLSGGVMSTQSVRKIDGRTCFNSTFHLPSGELVIGTLDQTEGSYLVRFAKEEQALTFLSFEEAALKVKLGLCANHKIRLIEVEGSWDDLPKAQQFLIEQQNLSPWRHELFLDRGQLYLDINEPAISMGDVVCNCLQLSLQDIINAPPVEEGLPAGAGGVCGGCAGKVNALMGEDIWSLANVTIEDDSHPLYRTVRLKPIFSEKKPHIPGQHISLQCLVGSVFVERSYTLTSDNSSDAYEIIVKKEIRGQMSQRFFSSNLDEFVIRVSEPRGNYFWDKSTQHRVLNLAAGIGVTPALSMARSCAVDTVDYHKVGIHLSINQEDQQPFIPLLKALCAKNEGISLQTRTTSSEGRLSKEAISDLLAEGSWDAIFLCGPESYLRETQSHLLELGVTADRIFIEIFHQAGGKPDAIAEPVAVCQKPSETSFKPLSADEDPSLLEAAEAFLHQVYSELEMPSLFDARWTEVKASISALGYYDHTYEEVAYGAKLSWRNSARCVGRQFWRGLDVRDCRDLTHPTAMAAALIDHMRSATNGGNLRPTMTVFAPDKPGAKGPRIWNNQLIRYAGYDLDGEILGDPANVEFTAIVLDKGWQPPKNRTQFDILPLTIEAPGHDLYLQDIPKEVCLEVPIIHPEYLWFEALDLKWYALPAVSDVEMSLGGIKYGALPFNGWYMETEIGARNFTDRDRYDLTRSIATKMGLDTLTERSLWRDRAQLELNRAVLYSFDLKNVTIMDHHEASDSFIRFVSEETNDERDVWAKWSWVVPPTGGSLTKVFHNEWEDKTLLPNFFYRDSPWSKTS